VEGGGCGFHDTTAEVAVSIGARWERLQRGQLGRFAVGELATGITAGHVGISVQLQWVGGLRADVLRVANAVAVLVKATGGVGGVNQGVTVIVEFVSACPDVTERALPSD
jgi:hypothetical protein